jgi:uncharacterized protein (DUF2062 family)
MSLASAVQGRLVTPVKALLIQGLSPDRVALTLAVGIAIAGFPIIGMTTILSIAAAFALGLNMPLIQTVNYLGAPIQLACILPFIRLGERLFGTQPLTMSLKEIVTLVTTEPSRAVSALWASTLHAVAAWALVAPVVGAAVYFGLRPVLRAAGRRFSRPAVPAS